ncbi:MAG: hypothetical protein MIO92_10410, partial [Methanosarcinaceae archaeon]|nr:hypothetical protein [Methanosarcinaceae archaeon]
HILINSDIIDFHDGWKNACCVGISHPASTDCHTENNVERLIKGPGIRSARCPLNVVVNRSLPFITNSFS